MKPGIHCARTHWIRGFMAFQLARRTRTVMLMVSAWPETLSVSGSGAGRRREGYAGRWEVKLDNIAALAAEREQLARTPEGGSRGGGFGIAPG
jgi:hypothetical protein